MVIFNTINPQITPFSSIFIYRIKNCIYWLPGDIWNHGIRHPARCEGDMAICGAQKGYILNRGLFFDDVAMVGVKFLCCPPSKIR